MEWKKSLIAGVAIAAFPVLALAQHPSDYVGTYRGKINLKLFNFETGKVTKGKIDTYVYIGSIDENWNADVDVDVNGMDVMQGWGIIGVKDGYLGVASYVGDTDVVNVTSQASLHFKKSGKAVGQMNLADYNYAGEAKINLKKISNSTGMRTKTEEKSLGIRRAEPPKKSENPETAGLGKIAVSKE